MTSEPASASRATLTWGGGGLVLATVVPIVAELAFLFPPPGTSWLYSAETPVAETASAVLLVSAFVVLAFGVRGERGIVGSSRVGRTALVLFALTSIVSAGYVPANLTVVAVNSAALAVMSILSWTLGIVRAVALIVAAMALSRIPFPAAFDVWLWGLVAIPLALLLTGVLLLVQGLRSPRAIETPAASAG